MEPRQGRCRSLVVAAPQNPESTAPLGLQEVGMPASWGWRPRLHATVPPGLWVDAEPSGFQDQGSRISTANCELSTEA